MFGSIKQRMIVFFSRAFRLRWLPAIVILVVLFETAMSQSPPRQGPSDVEIMLVKNAVTAVNHGNITGNYTVLRDLGSPAFRDKNSAAQLASIFQNLRERKIDLSPILVLDPQFTQAPGISQDGRIQLVGYFATQPLQVRFALAFQRVEAGWVIDMVSLGVVEQSPPRAASNNPQSQWPRTGDQTTVR